MNLIVQIEEIMDMEVQESKEAIMEDIIITFTEPYFKTLEDMNIQTEVSNTKQLRKDIDEVLQRVKDLEFRYETANVITKLQEGIMWLGMYLKRLGEQDPYPESRNPDSQSIEPTADGLKL